MRNILVLITILSAASPGWAVIEGAWVQPCHDGLAKLQINQNSISRTTESFHIDKNCQSKSFTFEVTGHLKTEADSWLDFSYEEIFLTVFVQSVIDDFNTRLACGLGTWEKAVPQRITGLNCAIFNYHRETQIPRTGDMKFGIYKVIGARLYFGALSLDRDGSSPEKRPQRLATEFFIRVPDATPYQK